AHRGEMAVSLSVQSGGNIVDPADHVRVVFDRKQRREAGRQFVLGTCGLGNPIALRNTIPVEPDQESLFDGLRSAAVGGEGRPIEEEQGGEGGKSYFNPPASNASPLKKCSAIHFHCPPPPAPAVNVVAPGLLDVAPGNPAINCGDLTTPISSSFKEKRE